MTNKFKIATFFCIFFTTCVFANSAAIKTKATTAVQKEKTQTCGAARQSAVPATNIRMLYKHLEPFTEIVAEGPFDIHIEGNSKNQQVQIQGDRNVLLTQMTVQSHNQVLYLAAPKIPSTQRIDVHLNLSSLQGIHLMHAARATGGNVKSQGWLRIDVQDVSSLVLRGEVKLSKIVQNGSGLVDVYWTGSDDLRVYTQGNGKIKVAGTTHYLYAYLNGATQLNAHYLRANNIWVRTTGNAFAQVMPLNSLRSFALDSSNIYYFNRPKYLTRFSDNYASVLLAPEATETYSRYPRSLK